MLVWRWLRNIPVTDAVEYSLAPTLQLVIIAIGLAPVLGLVEAVLDPGDSPLPPGTLEIVAIFELLVLGAIVMLRRGRFRIAAWFLLFLIYYPTIPNLIDASYENMGEMQVFHFLPLVFAGLFISRRAAVLVFVISSAAALAATLGKDPNNLVPLVTVTFIGHMMLVGLLVTLARTTLRNELRASRLHNAALEQARASLQATTADLHRANERLAVTLRSIGDAVITTSVDGKVTFMNDVAQALTGWTHADAEGQPLATVFHIVNETTRQPVESPVDKVLREGKIVGLANHTILLTRDGREVPIDDSGAPIRDHNGELVGIVLVFRDITERRRLEIEREKLFQLEQAARIEAEKANALKLQFLAMVSHELRTPLTSIKGFASTLLARDVDFTADDQREFIEVIDEESDKLTELVEQLLVISRMQAGNLKIEPEPVEFGRILAVATAQLGAISADHDFKTEIAPDLPIVQADPTRIAQVVVNLVSNAVKFSPTGSEIILRARPDGDKVLVSVVDQGAGIPPEHREVVFEAFRQVGRKDGSANGAGLGLTICKGIIEGHGQSIWIDDTPTGTSMSFTLAAANASVAASQAAASA